jgi:glycosyltransferase involved in cell wall biosynthesis
MIKKQSLSSKITIAQILPNIENGGVERGVLDLSKASKKHDDLELIVISAGGSMISQFDKYKIKHIKLSVNSKNPLIIFLNIFRLAIIIKKYKINICHARSRAPAWSAYFACKLTRSKFLTTFHGVYSLKGVIAKNSFFKKLYNSIMVKPNLIIAVSNFIKNHIQQEYKIPESKIQVIHRGVDLDYFSRKKVLNARIVKIIENLKLQEDKNIILLPGRFTSWKGHDLLLEALEDIRSENFICLMVGKSNQSYNNHLQKLIKAKGLAGKVQMLDHVSDMPALYMVSTIILSTSTRPEAFGRIAIEAGAMEKIIIATNLGGAKETILDNETGFLFNHESSKELSEKIKKVLSLDIKTREEMGIKARERIEKYFSSKKMISNILNIYRNIS